jgi:uncharacterized NAD(P)/FAD-binding protein YdhS
LGLFNAQKVAIVGSGPTGLYTFAALVEQKRAMSVTIFERGDKAGVGMPYNDGDNIRLMLANIASIEIPPIGETYLEWVNNQPNDRLRRFGVNPDSIDERTFLPRLLLGEYFRDQFLWLLNQALEAGMVVTVHEGCDVTDIDPRADGVWLEASCLIEVEQFDMVVIATGHVWPAETEATKSYFPSPWSGLVDAEIPAAKVGILGTSLSAIDAAMAVATQHGKFSRDDNGAIHFAREVGSERLTITLMSRSGILPEADFWCPIPYEPLHIVTTETVAAEIAKGEQGLLDRVFALAAAEIARADPIWAARTRLNERTVDDFADAYFADRKMHDPFRWAEYNLAVVEKNKADKFTVAWRYAILRLHEVVQDIVPHLDEQDRARFDAGLRNVFVDNYAAIPSESIRRLIALREAGVIDILELGQNYKKLSLEDVTEIVVDDETYRYAVFIDARGQRPLKSKDLPFPSLRRQLLTVGEDIPDVGENYALLAPDSARGKVAFGALPYLIHDNPFIQGITASAEIGAAIARGVLGETSRVRRWLSPLFDF